MNFRISVLWKPPSFSWTLSRLRFCFCLFVFFLFFFYKNDVLFFDNAAVCVRSGSSSNGCVVPTFSPSCCILIVTVIWSTKSAPLVAQNALESVAWFTYGGSEGTVAAVIWIIIYWENITGWHLMKGTPDYLGRFYPSFLISRVFYELLRANCPRPP